MSFLFSCCQQDPGKGHFYEVQTHDEKGKVRSKFINNLQDVKDWSRADRVLRVERSDYDELMKQYTGSKQWTDPEFPPGKESLGTIQNVPEDCKWKRISEILDEPQLFDGTVEPKDVIQGSLGDCYFLSAVAALAEVQGRIYNVFGDQKFNPNGIYRVQLRIDGVIQEIIIDDYVPVNLNDEALFCQPNKNEFWVLILEKAWAKAHGSYANIVSGTPTEVFKAITYAPSRLEPIKQSEEAREKLWEQILDEAQKNHPCCCGTKANQELVDVGLVPGHAYTLIDAVSLEDEDNHYHKLLKLRNPWGKRQYTGPGRQTDAGFWSNIPSSADRYRFYGGREEIENDGIFFIKYEDFCEYFNEVHFCFLKETPMYEVQALFCDKKHGTIYTFTVKKDDEYTIQLHQSGIRGEDPVRVEEGLNRTTLLLARGDNYEFLDGSLKYQEEDNMIKARLAPGKYYVFAKVDPTCKYSLVPDKMSVSCYSSTLVDIVPEQKQKHPEFFQKVFLPYARNHKRKELNNGKMWISWKLFFTKGGYAFIAFGVDASSDKKFVVQFDEKDFNEMGYTLKRPYKGKEAQQLEVYPGEEQIIVCRVTNGPLQPMKFPPRLDIQTDKA